MDNCYTLKDFNNLTLELCGDIKKSVPALKEKINKTQKLLEENPEGNQYLNYFVKHVVPFMYIISKMDVDLIKENKVNILSGLSFEDLWVKLKEEEKLAIWKYLFTLYLIASECDEYSDIIEKNKEHVNYEKISFTLRKHGKIVNQIKNSSNKIAEDMIKNFGSMLGENEEEIQDFFGKKILENKDLEKSIENSNIGKLAQTVASGLSENDVEFLKDPKNLLTGLSQGKMDGQLGNIISNIGQNLEKSMKNSDINEGNIMEEIGGMFGPLLGEMMGNAGGTGGSGGLNPMMSMMSTMMGGAMGGDNKKNKKKNNKHKRKVRPTVTEVGQDIVPEDPE